MQQKVVHRFPINPAPRLEAYVEAVALRNSPSAVESLVPNQRSSILSYGLERALTVAADDLLYLDEYL